MFQQTVNRVMGFGIAGELQYTNSPYRAFPYQLISAPNPNVVGATGYTLVSEGVAMAGGEGQLLGVLVNPKVYTNFLGLNPTMTLPDDTIGEIANLGYFTVLLRTAANPGDSVVMDNAAGFLSSVAKGTAPAATQTVIGTVEIRSTAANGLAICSIKCD